MPGTVTLACTARTRGGVWRHVEDLAGGLARAGIEVTIGLLPSATELHRACTRLGLRYVPLHRSLGASADVWHIHLHDTYDRVALCALAARVPFGPSVVTEHLPRSHASDIRLEPHHPRTRGASELKTLFKRVEFAMADSVIAVGASSAAFLQERYRLPAGRVTTVHNGIATPRTPAPQRAADGPLRVVAVGSLGRQKGHDVLLRAAGMSSTDWMVTIVGDGAQNQSLRAIAADLPGDRVRFTGWVEDPRSELIRADVVCMPSRWESFPYAALEASALSRPVVASRVDGLDEIVVDGATGILVAPERPDELSAALDRLAAHPELLAEYGRAARARVSSTFTLPRMLEDVIAAYGRVHARRRARRRRRRPSFVRNASRAV